MMVTYNIEEYLLKMVCETAIIKKHNGTTIEVDNQWVIPYSPLLSKTFNAHINVEYCNSVKAIKYICKYVPKGSNMAVFGLQSKISDIDEIVQYQAGRYISSNEAVWRILSFLIHERNPAVVHLAAHLQNGQRVYFSESNVQQRALNPTDTTLTAFFLLCQIDSFAKKMLYTEVPSYHTWNSKNISFERHKQGKSVDGQPTILQDTTIGRLYTIHPNQHERFFLHLLLVNVRCPTSFENSRTENGTTHETYKSACEFLNLLENDQHWDTASMTRAKLKQVKFVHCLESY